jgi:RNA polymerase sigma-70 factor (ECF subfamily)
LRRELNTLADDNIAEWPSPIKAYNDPVASLQAKELRSFLHQQIEVLPESYRIVITLRYQQDLSYAEIAEILDIPLGTVKTGIYRAREHLRKALSRLEETSVWT